MALWKIAEHRKPAIRTLFIILSLPFSLSMERYRALVALSWPPFLPRPLNFLFANARIFWLRLRELNRQMRPDAIASSHLVSSHLLSHLVECVLLSLCVTAAFIGATSWIRCNYRSSCYYSEPRKVHYGWILQPRESIVCHSRARKRKMYVITVIISNKLEQEADIARARAREPVSSFWDKPQEVEVSINEKGSKNNECARHHGGGCQRARSLARLLARYVRSTRTIVSALCKYKIRNRASR